MNTMRTKILPFALLVLSAFTSGCALAHLAGGMAQNAEYQKLIEVLPRYDDLSGKLVAVLVDADMTMLYEHPDLVANITTGVSGRLQRKVPGIKVVRPDQLIAWQWQTQHWNAMPYGEMAESLGVDRIIHIDVTEYRLHPPGNRWLWEGICAANVSVIERDAFDPDMFVDSFRVVAEFPGIAGVDRSAANENQIQTGVLSDFITRTAWLFYTHLEPKYPDHYTGPPPDSVDS